MIEAIFLFLRGIGLSGLVRHGEHGPTWGHPVLRRLGPATALQEAAGPGGLELGTLGFGLGLRV